MILFNSISIKTDFPGSSVIKNPPAMQETQDTQVQSLGWEDPLKEGMATHSSILIWRIPWTEKPDGLQSTGSQRVGHDWSNLALRHNPVSTKRDCICRESVSRSVVSDSLQPHGLQPARLLCPWNSQPTPWSGLPCPPPGDLLNPRLPHLQADSLSSEPPGKLWSPFYCKELKLIEKLSSRPEVTQQLRERPTLEGV